MSSYHFSLGNSTDGPIGFCARVIADTPEQAVDKLQNFMVDNEEVGAAVPRDCAETGLEYLNVYLHAGGVSVDDIDEIDEIDDGEPA